MPIVQPTIEFFVRYAEILLLGVAFKVAADQLDLGALRVLVVILVLCLVWHVVLGAYGFARFFKASLFPHRGGSRTLWAIAVALFAALFVFTITLLLSVITRLDQIVAVTGR